MTVTIAALTQIAAQAGPNVNASLFDDNWAAIRNAVNGLVYTSAEVDALIAAIRINPRGYLAGLGTSNNASDATNDIDIAAGTCRDSTNAKDITLASALTKRLDAAWAVGTGNGWLDIGTIANGSYHTYAILRSDTGVVDALASRNPDTTATITMTIASPAVVTWTDHGLQAGSTVVFTTTGALPTGVTAGTRYYVISTGLTASAFQFSATEGGSAVNTSGSQSGTHTGTAAPVMPTNYDYRRRIASLQREGATLIPYTQVGDNFLRTTPAADVAAVNPGTSAVTRSVSVPIGIVLDAQVMMNITNGATANGIAAYLSALVQTDEVASATRATANTGGAAAENAAWMGFIRTNRNAQFRSRVSFSDAQTTLNIEAIGWTDRRGRDD